MIKRGVVVKLGAEGVDCSEDTFQMQAFAQSEMAFCFQALLCVPSLSWQTIDCHEEMMQKRRRNNKSMIVSFRIITHYILELAALSVDLQHRDMRVAQLT